MILNMAATLAKSPFSHTISLIANHVGHLLMCSFAMYRSSLVKCLLCCVVLYAIAFFKASRQHRLRSRRHRCAFCRHGEMQKWKMQNLKMLATDYGLDLSFVYTDVLVPDWERWLTAATQHHVKVLHQI